MIILNKIKEFASCRGDRDAIIYCNNKLTWLDYYNQTKKIISAIQNNFNTSKIKSICYISPNRHELFVIAAAATTLEIPFIGIDYTQPPENIRHMLEITTCGLIVISSSFFLEEGVDIRSFINLVPIIDLDNGLNSAKHYINLMSEDSYEYLPTGKRSFKAISFTSGTSGLPKAAVRYSSFDDRRFNYFKSRYGFSSNDRYMLAMPMYHAAGNGWARLFLSLGAAIIIAKPHDAEDMVQLIKNEKISTSSMTPPLLSEIISRADGKEHVLKPNSLKFVIVGGKNFPAKLKLDALHILGPIVYEYYGSTETGVNTIAEPYEIMKDPTSVGKPYDGNKILILGNNNQKQKNGEIGRVAISSYMNMDEYFNTGHDVIEYNGDEYLLTAEAGYLKNEYLYLVNRAQKIKGLNLYEAENAINKHPLVRDVAIVTINNENSKVACGIVIENRADNVKREILNFAKKELKKSKLKCQHIKLLDKIPYSPSGKVITGKLKDILIHGSKENNNSRQYGTLAGILCLILTTLSWGGMFPVAKNALVLIDAVHISLIRYGIASIILLLILIIKEGLLALNPGRQIIKILFFGSLGFAGFSILAFAGLAYTKPQHGAVIMALMPLISVIMMWVLKNQRPSNFTFGSIFFALLGVILVVSKGNISSLLGGALLPNMVILLGAFCWVTYTIGATYIEGFSSLRYTAISAALGSISILFISCILNYIGITHIPSIYNLSKVSWELLYLIIFAGVIAVFSWNAGIKNIGPTNGVLFINLVPTTAFIIALVGGEKISLAEIFGSTLVILSLVANNVYSRRQTKNNLA